MKIYTKTGDAGMTSLIGGHRVPKYNQRIEAYGTVDELNSHLGIVIAGIKDNEQQLFLTKVQSDLFTIGSKLASVDGSKMVLPEIYSEDVTQIEEQIDRMDLQLEPLKNFVLPGGSMIVAQIHVARCVCRRAERLVVYLNYEEKLEEVLITYLNRLSDYLFTLSRYEAMQTKTVETPWNPSKR